MNENGEDVSWMRMGKETNEVQDVLIKQASSGRKEEVKQKTEFR